MWASIGSVVFVAPRIRSMTFATGHVRSTTFVRRRKNTTGTWPRDPPRQTLSNDASRSHERRVRGNKSLDEADHHPVASLEGDKCARVEDDAGAQAALLRRPRLVSRRNMASARRTSSWLGWTCRQNSRHCLSSSASSSRSSTTPVTQAETGASPAAFLMRAATLAGTLIVVRRIDITIA